MAYGMIRTGKYNSVAAFLGPSTSIYRGEIMAGRRATYFKSILKDFRERKIKKPEALAVIAGSDSFPGFARTKARKMLKKLEESAPF